MSNLHLSVSMCFHILSYQCRHRHLRVTVTSQRVEKLRNDLCSKANLLHKTDNPCSALSRHTTTTSQLYTLLILPETTEPLTAHPSMELGMRRAVCDSVFAGKCQSGEGRSPWGPSFLRGCACWKSQGREREFLNAGNRSAK